MRSGHLGSPIFDESDDGADQVSQAAAVVPEGRSERRARAEKRERVARLNRKKRRRLTGGRKTIVLLVTLALVLGSGAFAVSALWPLVTSLTASNDYVGEGSGHVSVTVNNGDSSRTIGATLALAGVVKTVGAFENAADLDPQSADIQPGLYMLHLKMSAQLALAALLNPLNRKVSKVTIREGLWTSEIISKLSAATGQPLSAYLTALKDPQALGLPVQADGDVEGYLFPSTYSFDPKTTAATQLQTLVAKALDELSVLGVSPAQANGVLTIASIVEAEARATTDRAKVARVIVNRLAKGMPLQLDTTVSFIAQQRGKVGTTDAQRAVKSPYNTYLVTGLPPGPIDSPGLLSLQAALNPAPGPWLYFVAVNPTTGETKFAVTAAGHAANVKLFLAWCSKNPGQC
jgi:UPF0755 protein